MKKIIATLALALAVSAASCAHTPGGSKEQLLSLNEGQSAGLSGGGRLTFVNVVNESRCPTGVQCVWAGTATVRFRLAKAAGDTPFDVLAVLPGGVGKDDVANQLPVDTLGVSLTLAELTPYPVAGKDPGKRRALVRVRPLD
jgi:hypothetical protein